MPPALQVSRIIIQQRRRGGSTADSLHYNYAFVAMEITRMLAQMFHVILTRVQESPNYPLQPDMHVSAPFEVDFVGTFPALCPVPCVLCPVP
jgi:hypothetical protein